MKKMRLRSTRHGYGSKVSSKRMYEHMTPKYPWDPDGSPDDDEIDRWIEEEIFDEMFDSFNRLDGWGGLVLDKVGYEEILNKKEWFKEFGLTPRSVDTSLSGALWEKRAGLPTRTDTYRVWVADESDEAQINETRIWLEGLADKSDLGEFIEMSGVHKNGRRWSNLILDPAGYETVLNRKEWIVDIVSTSRYKVVDC